MSLGTMVNLMRGGILQVLMCVAPVLIPALGIGLIVAIFQAITSIQEQTLTFLPKFLVILLVIALLGGFMLNSTRQYTLRIFQMIPQIARG
ncbi:MAG: flagellar biosynthesis protein FliQ [Treponema sp.]|nr:flagellar biosynthesis protein FliQ [Treponema sp.]